MAITNGYCTLAEIKAALRVTDTVDDVLLENSIEGASRRIDGYCSRFFFQTASTAVNLFARHQFRLLTQDISSVTGLTVKTDTSGDGTYATTLTLNTDFIVEPTNAALEGRPFRTLTMVGSKSFPISYLPTLPTVQVTAVWGWPAVPDDVREACILLAMRQFARYNSALGVLAFGEMAITVRAVDPDVRDLLSPYRIVGVA